MRFQNPLPLKRSRRQARLADTLRDGLIVYIRRGVSGPVSRRHGFLQK
jgi:hypothetical protein